jgi:hypothetical protein
VACGVPAQQADALDDWSITRSGQQRMCPPEQGPEQAAASGAWPMSAAVSSNTTAWRTLSQSDRIGRMLPEEQPRRMAIGLLVRARRDDLAHIPSLMPHFTSSQFAG